MYLWLASVAKGMLLGQSSMSRGSWTLSGEHGAHFPASSVKKGKKTLVAKGTKSKGA